MQFQSGAHFKRARSSNESGHQIDLMFQRQDNVWVVCEIKYQSAEIGKAVINEVEEKIASIDLPKRVSIYRVLITASAISESLKREPYFDRVIGLEELG